MAVSQTRVDTRGQNVAPKRLGSPVFGRVAFVVDWLLLLIGPPAVVLFFGRLVPHRHGEPYPAGAAAVVMFVAVGACLLLVLIRVGLALGGAQDRMFEHPRSAAWRLGGACAAFLAGVMFALVVNRMEGALQLGDFFTSTGPIVGGFVVGIVFAAVSTTERQHCALRAQRVIGVAYMLGGALCAVLGTLHFHGHDAGYAYGDFFLAISGAFAASTYILLEMVVVSTGVSDGS